MPKTIEWSHCCISRFCSYSGRQRLDLATAYKLHVWCKPTRLLISGLAIHAYRLSLQSVCTKQRNWIILNLCILGRYGAIEIVLLLRATAATAVARLSHRNSVCPSVCPSVTRVDQSKTVQYRITKSSPSAAWKTLLSGTVKLFHKFEGVTPNEGAKWEGGRENLRHTADTALAEQHTLHPLVSTSKTL